MVRGTVVTGRVAAASNTTSTSSRRFRANWPAYSCTSAKVASVVRISSIAWWRSTQIGRSASRKQHHIDVQPPLPGQLARVLVHLGQGGLGGQNLLDCLVAKHPHCLPSDQRGQQDVSVGGELHDEFSATTRNRIELLLRLSRSSRSGARFRRSASQRDRASSR